jgi:hypothetical protein
MPNVKAIRRELNLKLAAYRVIFDAIEGELQIKGYVDNRPPGLCGGVQVSYQNVTMQTESFQPKMAERYLPIPNVDDDNERSARYQSYVKRAVWYGFTSNTLEGMVGEIFKRDPIVTLPPRLESLKDNADGNSLNLIQLLKKAVRFGLPYSRCGIHTDYTNSDTPATIADIKSGKVGVRMKVYAPWDIINWRTAKDATGKTVLTLVVLRDVIDSESDPFETQLLEQYKALRLDADGNYVIETYKVDENNDKESTLVSSVTPKDSNGNPFKEILFSFIGGENNDPEVDKPLLYDLASLNVAHYRNSADYEESCFLVGQPTPVMSGLTEEWVKQVLKGTVQLGSRAAIPLPVGGKAELLQADPNQMTKEAMEHKERQAVSIGAKLVQDKQVTRTATDALMESSAEASSLANVAVNTSVAFKKALTWGAQFVGDDPSKIECTLNTEFELMNMSADDQSKLVAAWQRGAICWPEMRQGLRKAGTATMPDDEAKALIEQEQADLIATGVIADPFTKVDRPAKPTNNPPGQQKTAAVAAVKG